MKHVEKGYKSRKSSRSRKGKNEEIPSRLTRNSRHAGRDDTNGVNSLSLVSSEVEDEGVCPECGAQMMMIDGCQTCPACAHSHCAVA